MAKNETIRVKQQTEDSFSALQAITQSAQRTNENSPPIHRWGISGVANKKSVKRTAESHRTVHFHLPTFFSRPLCGLQILEVASDPSSELLGYSHASAFTDLIWHL